MNFCARCRRAFSTTPVIVDGLGYGPSCGRKMKPVDLVDEAARRVKSVMIRRRARRARGQQLELSA